MARTKQPGLPEALISLIEQAIENDPSARHGKAIMDGLPQEAKDFMDAFYELAKMHVGDDRIALGITNGLIVGLDLVNAYPQYAQVIADWFVPAIRSEVGGSGDSYMTDLLVERVRIDGTESDTIKHEDVCPSCGKKAREMEMHTAPSKHEKPVRISRKNGN